MSVVHVCGVCDATAHQVNFNVYLYPLDIFPILLKQINCNSNRNRQAGYIRDRVKQPVCVLEVHSFNFYT